ncbi:glucosidase 2 subunit beta [Pycnococcus provasolii]
MVAVMPRSRVIHRRRRRIITHVSCDLYLVVVVLVGIFVVVCSKSQAVSQAVSQDRFLGSEKCASSIPRHRINDDFCDCADGSDETETPACSHVHAKFTCKNEAHVKKDISTTRIQDGVCDCCDGSDETAKSRRLVGQPPCDAKACEVLAKQAKHAASAYLEEALKGREAFQKDAARARRRLLRNARVEQLWAEAERAWRADLRRRGEDESDDDDDDGTNNPSQEEDADAVARRVAAQWVSVPGATDADLFDDDDSKADADEARDATRDAQKSLEMPLGTDEDKPPPSEIPDPNASKPEEWDDEEDGEWEHPTVHNPEHDDWVAGADKRKDDLRHASDRRRHFADSVREEVLRFRLVERADDGTPDERIKRLRLWRIWPYANDDAACPEFTDSQYTYKLCLFGEVKQDSTLLGKMDDGEMLGTGGLDDNAASATTPTLGVLAEALDAVIPAAAAAASSAKGTGAGDRLTLNFRHGDSGFFCGSEGRRLSATVTCGAEPTLKAVTEPERCSYQAEVAIPAMCLGSSPTTTHDEL